MNVQNVINVAKHFKGARIIPLFVIYENDSDALFKVSISFMRAFVNIYNTLLDV